MNFVFKFFLETQHQKKIFLEHINPGELSLQHQFFSCLPIFRCQHNLKSVYSKRAVDDVRYTGKICVLDIEMEGVKQVKGTDLDPLLVFVMPPSIEELERRLRGRNTEHEDALRKRLDTARREIEFGLFFIIIFIILNLKLNQENECM